jgi:Tol biopolymer transport system component/DNA-binding winged helix-turn-helix (wHTH) protein
MSNASSGLYTFGSYRLEAASRVLTRSGAVVPLAPKTFDLLVFMAESGGRLLSKSELMVALWNGTFVEEANLSFQMSSLRKALGEDGNRWIEAVPKYGYRFKAPVERCEVPENSQPDVGRAPGVEPTVARTRSRGSRFWLITGVAAALVVAVGFLSWLPWSRKQATNAALHVIPVTSYSGNETTPDFSPDGGQIAFSWDGEKGDNLDIYVKVVGDNRALRLTSDPRPEFSPAWSPDGRHIAFFRDGQDSSEIVLVSALGGPERVIAKLPKWGRPEHLGEALAGKHCGDLNDRSLAWFPDGESLAIVGRNASEGPNVIFLLSVGTGEMKALTSPPDRSYGDGLPSVSPDGHSLAYARTLSEYFTSASVYVVPLSDTKSPVGEAQRLAGQNDDIVAGLAWTSDSRRLVFSTGRGLWSLALKDRVLVPLALPGYNPKFLAMSAKGDRLAFAESTGADLDIWRVDGPALVHRGSGRALVPPARFISSTHMDTNPQYSPDGSRIAFTSSRSGTVQIWVCDSHGSDPVQLTTFETDASTPRWSPGSRYIAFDSPTGGAADIYVVPAKGGPVRRITPESSQEDMASWSHDGKWIYFESDRSGVFQIWKAPLAEGTALQVTENGGAEAFESRDGRFVYYTKWEQRGIWRKPTEGGGPEMLVIDRGSPYHWGLFDNGVCLMDVAAAAGPVIDCLDFDTNRITTVSRLPKNTHINVEGPSFSVSPDGRSMLYVTGEREESDIMMVDNFR